MRIGGVRTGGSVGGRFGTRNGGGMVVSRALAAGCGGGWGLFASGLVDLVDGQNLGFSGLLVLFEVEEGGRRVVEVVGRVLVPLSLLEESVAEPVFNNFEWQSGLL